MAEQLTVGELIYKISLEVVNKSRRAKHRHSSNCSILKAYVQQEMRLSFNSNNPLDRGIFHNELLS